MIAKLFTGAGCLTLLAATLPIADAHDDLFLTSWETSRYVPTDHVRGVAGTYNGPAGTLNWDPVHNRWLSSGMMFCDMEVGGDATHPMAQDERTIDGNAGGVNLDGNWDDGGEGGACHTNYYLHADYNTPGCQDNKAYGSDETRFVFLLGAACDWMTVEGAEPSDVYLKCFDGRPLDFGYCLEAFLNCAGSATACEGGIAYCGADSSPDGINYGWSDAGVRFPYDANIDTPDQGWAFVNEPLACAEADATTQIYVFSGADETGLSKPTRGKVWSGFY